MLKIFCQTDFPSIWAKSLKMPVMLCKISINKAEALNSLRLARSPETMLSRNNCTYYRLLIDFIIAWYFMSLCVFVIRDDEESNDKKNYQLSYLQCFSVAGQVVSTHYCTNVMLHLLCNFSQSFVKRKIKCLVNLVR